MNKGLLLATLLVVVMLLAACGGTGATTGGATVATPSATEASVTSMLTEDYEDAASLRNQLALGILRMEGTAQALNAGQAGTLLPLWQTLKALAASSTAESEEMEALQEQIAASLTGDQMAAIAALKLTNADLQAYYVEVGVAEVRTPEPGVTPQSSSLKDLPPEQREAARATAEALGTPVGTGRSSGTSKSDVLLDNVIEMLTELTDGS
jgi:hypothetical protein